MINCRQRRYFTHLALAQMIYVACVVMMWRAVAICTFDVGIANESYLLYVGSVLKITGTFLS